MLSWLGPRCLAFRQCDKRKQQCDGHEAARGLDKAVSHGASPGSQRELNPSWLSHACPRSPNTRPGHYPLRWTVIRGPERMWNSDRQAEAVALIDLHRSSDIDEQISAVQVVRRDIGRL